MIRRFLVLLLLVPACATDGKDTAPPGEPSATDTTESGETGESDTADTGDTSAEETGDTADTSDTSDTADTSDTSDTAPPAPAPLQLQAALNLGGSSGRPLAVGALDGDEYPDLGLLNYRPDLDYDGSGAATILYGHFTDGDAAGFPAAIVHGTDVGAWDKGCEGATPSPTCQRADMAGWSMAAGDVDGDGRSDLVVTAPGENGALYDSGALHLWSGPVTDLGALTTSTGAWYADVAGAQLGGQMELADWDGDGALDMVVPIFTNGGWSLMDQPGLLTGTQIVSVADAHPVTVPLDPHDQLVNLHVGRDWDGDGVTDLMVGQAYDNASHVWVVRGPPPLTIDVADADILIDGPPLTTLVEPIVEGPADTNGDGLDDLTFCAQGDGAYSPEENATVWRFGTWVTTGSADAADAGFILHLGEAGCGYVNAGELFGPGLPVAVAGVRGSYTTHGIFLLDDGEWTSEDAVETFTTTQRASCFLGGERWTDHANPDVVCLDGDTNLLFYSLP